MGNYFCRNVSPRLSLQLAADLEEGIVSLVKTATGFGWEELSDVARRRLRLPVRYRGCSLRKLTDRIASEYMGGMCQGILPMLNRTTAKGETKVGILNVPSVIALLGAGSFYEGKEATRWTRLLSHEGLALAADLRDAWGQLQAQYAAAGAAPSTPTLLTQLIDGAGSLSEQPVTNKLTRALTASVEEARYLQLDHEMVLGSDVPLHHQENAAWRNCDRY